MDQDDSSKLQEEFIQHTKKASRLLIHTARL